jgi:hypothetical protein
MQRAKAKLAGYAGASAVVALHWMKGVVEFTEAKLGDFVTLLSPQTAKDLARRHRERFREGQRWFTADEAALVEALANLIVPTDEAGPGAERLGLLGRSVGETLDRLVAGSPRRQALYARGLLALDRLAKGEYQSAFLELSRQQQVRLLHLVDRVQQKWSRPSSLTAKIKAKIVRLLYDKWRSSSPAAELFPMLVQDVLEAFYTDPVSWEWLGYDGPPMPEGYLNLFASRSRGSTLGS